MAKRRDFRKGMLTYPFVALPLGVLQSDEWAALPVAAVKLVIDLAAQYTGKNNGRLCPSYDVLQRHGWASKATLLRAKVAIHKTSFVIMTRRGHAPRTCEWVGFSWWRLDYDVTMDIDPKHWPHLNFMPALAAAKIDPNRRGERPPEKRVVRSQNCTDGPPKAPLRGIKTVPMDPAGTPPLVPKRDHATEVNAEKSCGTKTGDVLDIAICGSDGRPAPTTPTIQRPADHDRLHEVQALVEAAGVAWREGLSGADLQTRLVTVAGKVLS